MSKYYHKLIRDKIPEIIRADKNKPYFKVLNKKEFLKEIKKKINEEAEELIRAETKDEIMDELVDIQELLDVLAGEIGVLKIQIRQQQKIKGIKPQSRALGSRKGITQPQQSCGVLKTLYFDFARTICLPR